MWIYLIEDSETASAMAIALDYMPFLRNKYGLRFEAPASFNTYTEQGARSTFTRSSAKGTYYFFQTSNDLSIIEAIGPAAAFPPMQDMFDNIAKSFMRLH
jgi:hypothetical protein